MNDFIFDSENFLPKLSELELNYPNLNIFFNIDDANERIKNIQYCEVSGVKFSSLSDIYFIPTKPFENFKVGAYQTAVVCEASYDFYLKLYQYINNNPNLPDIENYKKNHLKFELTKENVLHNTTVEKIEISDHSKLFSLFEMKTKREKLKDAINNNTSKIVVNNLKPIEAKRAIDIKKAFNNSRNMPGRLVQASLQEKEQNKKSLFLVKQIYYKLSTFRKKSEEKGMTCNMNYDNSKHLFEIKHCQLTGMVLTKNDYEGPAKYSSFSIDRINRFEGYNTSNVIVMCHFANQIKGRLEKFNYSKDPDKIKEILEQTKEHVMNYYKDRKKNPFVFDKIVPIEVLIQDLYK